MSGERIFHCPSCGAALEYAGGDTPTVQCPYCDTSVIVPPELRTRAQPEMSAVTVDLSRTARRSCAAPIILVVGLIILAVGGVIAFLTFTVSEEGSGETDRWGISVGGPDADSSFAQIVLTFGGEGIGPGLFDDARYVTVDSAGNIYVGNYSDGRIQVFDASGKFLSLWMVDPETPLRGLAIDRQGVVYVVQRGRIYRYEGATGELLGEVEYAEGIGFDDVVVTADGGLLAAWQRHEDTLVRFSSDRQVVWTTRNAISDVTGDSELDTRVAVDGLGNVYALGQFNEAVFKFSPEGKYINRFGGDGDEPGQFRAPGAIAVDGQGRVYVSDFKGIQVFDADGRYMDLIDVEGYAYGLTFDDEGALFVAVGDQVIKYAITGP